jgi:phosphopantetheinyl transferase (holo-ACP synthase)
MKNSSFPLSRLLSFDISEQGTPFFEKLNARFAAKEAAYKAFQPERKVTWKDLEVWKHTSGKSLNAMMANVPGKPYIRIWQGPHKVDYPLSISHEKDYIVAVVMNIPISQTEPPQKINFLT